MRGGRHHHSDRAPLLGVPEADKGLPAPGAALAAESESRRAASWCEGLEYASANLTGLGERDLNGMEERVAIAPAGLAQ